MPEPTTAEAAYRCWRKEPHVPHMWTLSPEEGGVDCPGIDQPAPVADERRELYADAMLEHHITDEADADGNRRCSCTEWQEGPDEYWDHHMADVYLAVRDQELEQARAELAALKRAHIALASQAGKDQAAVERVREWLPALRRAVAELPATCRYHGDRLDPDRFGQMTRSEACCDTGRPARRRREAMTALAALDLKEQP
ncbi:hypothetical protein AB0D12_31935 [Streptomyces sp. NPDC048479]|uniref:hypothetical protein n=1 Tax=Streptomyces sp. NPDC048479 TaxID=3154725 RepID=UPI00341AE690